jgi:NAD(P)-dependent dehydrogenase (short-subunit alcohol dehydrogenase family)
MKKVMITGANKGIGLAIVEAVLREQSDFGVILGSRDISRGNAAREKLLNIDHGWVDRLEVLEIDVTDDNSVADAAARVASQVDHEAGELIGFVNNAGTIVGTLSEVIDVNFYGMKRVSERFAPLLKEAGRIVNVTSAAGPNFVAQCSDEWKTFFVNEQVEWQQLDTFLTQSLLLSPGKLSQKGLPGDSDYGFSKACANLYTLLLARMHPDLRVNACTPGFIETDLTHEMTRGSGKSAHELGMKQPADGARVVMHLLFGDIKVSGQYFGSDSLRSPLDHYRAPGSPAYEGA